MNIHIMKIDKKIPIILFYISIFLCIIPQILGIGGFIDDLKYLFFMLTFVFSYLYIQQNDIKLDLKKEFYYLISLILLIFFVSVIRSFQKNSFSVRMIVELIYLLIPTISAFCLINIYIKTELYRYIKILFILCLFTYLFELISKGINLSSLLDISFTQSYSPFESYIFADLSLFFFCFFSYFYKKDVYKDIKLLYILSFMFVFFTFKRVLVLFAVILFILNKFDIFEYKVNRKIVNIVIIIFIFVTISYTWLLQGDNSLFLKQLFSFDLEKFTVGRKWYFSIIENNMQFVTGYGSTTDILTRVLGQGKYLEMDLVKILIETGPLVLAYFIYVYWQQIANNVFSVLVLFFLFINMLFSHSLTTYYGWALFLLMFYMIKTETRGKLQ